MTPTPQVFRHLALAQVAAALQPIRAAEGLRGIGSRDGRVLVIAPRGTDGRRIFSPYLLGSLLDYYHFEKGAICHV